MLMGLAFVGLGVASNPAVTTIASTIQSVEGYYPGTLAYTNNNPGNLIYLPNSTIQTSNGATAGASGFAAFPTYQDGLNALYAQIQSYANQGLTINQMMAKYAPAGQGSNNPTAYANQIATALGVSPDATLADALAGSATAGIPVPDNSGIFDSADGTLADLQNAFSTGDITVLTDADWGTLAAGLAMVLGAAWVMTR